MTYQEVREIVNKLINKEYRNFTKALVSLEKKITDEDSLNAIYKTYMHLNTPALIHDDFQYIIEELMISGQITPLYVPEE